MKTIKIFLFILLAFFITGISSVSATNGGSKVTVTVTPNPILTVTKLGAGANTGIITFDTGKVCGAGTLTCTETYPLNTGAVSITANSPTVVWGGDCGSLGTVTMSANNNANKNCTATFGAATNYTLTITKVGTGTVTSDIPTVGAISCGADCTGSYPSGTSVTLAQSAGSGYAFSSWSANCANGQVTMDSSKTCIVTFNAGTFPPSILLIEPATNITSTSARLSANVTSDGNDPPVSRSICYGLALNSTSCYSAGTGMGTFFFDATGLTPNTTYYFRGKAENDKGLTYSTNGSVSSNGTFKTLATPYPNLKASAPTPNWAMLNVDTTFSSTISNEGTASTGASFNNFFQICSTASQAGICPATSTITDKPSSSMTALAVGGTGPATVAQTTHKFITAGTYSVRACADKSSSGNSGTINEGSVANENDNCSSWTDVIVSNQTATPTNFQAVQSACGSTSLSLSWDLVPTATTYQLFRVGVGAPRYTGPANSFVDSGLTVGNTYTYNLTAMGPNGTSGTATISKLVSGCTPPPTPTNLTVSPSACNNSWLNLAWTPSTGATNYKVYKDGSATPIMASTLASYNNCSDGTCRGSDDGLALDSTHSYTVKATNASGDSASSSLVSGTVASACSGFNTVPTVTTSVPTSVTSTSAILGGNVTNSGGLSVLVRGVAWDVAPNDPENLMLRKIDGAGMGNFASNYSLLLPNTTYNVRAFAANSLGHGWGLIKQFTTPPVVSTSPVVTSCTPNNTKINSGDSVNVAWTSTDATSCEMYAGSSTTDLLGGTGSSSGNKTLWPAKTVRYSIVCSKGGIDSLPFLCPEIKVGNIDPIYIEN